MELTIPSELLSDALRQDAARTGNSQLRYRLNAVGRSGVLVLVHDDEPVLRGSSVSDFVLKVVSGHVYFWRDAVFLLRSPNKIVSLPKRSEGIG